MGGGFCPLGGGGPLQAVLWGGAGGHCSTASQLIAMQCATDSTALFVSLGGWEGSKLRPPRINTSPSLPPSAAWPRVGGRRGGSQERMQIPPPTLGSLLPSATAVCPKGGGPGGSQPRSPQRCRAQILILLFLVIWWFFLRGGCHFFSFFLGGGWWWFVCVIAGGGFGGGGGLLNTEKLIMGGFFGTAGGRRVLGRLRRWAHTLIVMLGE